MNLELVLSILLAISLVINGFMLSKFLEFKEKIKNSDKVVSENNKLKDNFSITKGDMVLYEMGLNYGSGTKEQVNFTVVYEAEVLEVSIDKLKLKAISFTSTDACARDPKNIPGIIAFLNGKWQDKKDCKLIMDERYFRDKKLTEILN